MNHDNLFNTKMEDLIAKPLFTAEENRGKCVDMHELYFTFQNFKKVSISLISVKRNNQRYPLSVLSRSF
jgi:hypothetical protein